MGERPLKSRDSIPIIATGMVVMVVALAALGCSKGVIVKIDGSSTVFPITEAMAEEYQKGFGEFRVTVGVSGTGGGFQKLCNGEIHINDASRPIKPVEVEACADNGVTYIELPVAFDGLAILANPKNDWAESLTVDELREIWKPGSDIDKWSDIRPEWPDKDIYLVGPDTASGTFDYFTKAIVGEEGASRPDYTASADDNVLVGAVSREQYALGYLGFAYYEENSQRLKLITVDPGSGPVAPSRQTIMDGTYAPLSRPLFIYVSSEAANRAEVRQFVDFYLSIRNGFLLRQVGYVEFPDHVYDLIKRRFEEGKTGSVFGGQGSQIGVSLEQVLGGG